MITRLIHLYRLLPLAALLAAPVAAQAADLAAPVAAITPIDVASTVTDLERKNEIDRNAMNHGLKSSIASTFLNVQAVLETNPSTPAELVRAILVLIDLKHPAAAKPLVKKLIDAAPDDVTAAALVHEFGPAGFLKIARTAELIPEGRQLANSMIAANLRHARDPDQIANLIEKLGDPSPQNRFKALDSLRLAGPAVVMPLLKTLADPTQVQMHHGSLEVLAQLGNDAFGPMVAALDSPDASIAACAADALGYLKLPGTLIYLLGAAYRTHGNDELARAASASIVRSLGYLPTQAQAAALLERVATDYLTGAGELPHASGNSTNGNQPSIIHWHWDDNQQQLISSELSASAMRSQLAARTASDAYRLTPSTDPRFPQRQRLYLAATFNNSPAMTTYQQALAALAPAARNDLTASRGELLADVLDYTMRLDLPRAARLTASFIGRAGDFSLLSAESSEPCSLVRALSSPDRNVCFAALGSVVQLARSWRFPGAGRVPAALAWFITTSGAPKAVVAASSPIEAGRLAGLLAEIGYEPVAVTNGPDLLAEATSSADVALILVDSSLVAPLAADVVPLLRQDPRTARLPIALVTVPAEDGRYRRLLRYDWRTTTIIRPHSAAALAFQIDEVARKTKTGGVAGSERIAQAKAAIGWTSGLIATNHGAFDLRTFVGPLAQAIYIPQLSVEAAKALAGIGSSEAQTALVDFASQNGLSLQSREAAGAGFCENVAQHGISLTSEQIALQYERFKRSEQLDGPTRELLSLIIACLESRIAPAQVP